MNRPASSDPEAFALLVAEVFEAAGVLRRYGEGIAATAEQTQARWQLLSVLSEGDWTVPMAADRLGVSRQAIQRIANDIVADELAVFEENPHHRRSPFVRLTGKGKFTLASIAGHAQRAHHALAPKLETLDVAKLLSALRTMTSAVRSQVDGTADP
jgi:DNA-binding MarR family transcriptional regulator